MKLKRDNIGGKIRRAGKPVLTRFVSVMVLFAIFAGFVPNIDFLPSKTVRAEDNAATSGKCGDNLTWTLDDDGTFTISGTGEMYGYYYNFYNKTPWEENLDNINSVLIEKGVTSIGNYTFHDCINLTSVIIPDSVTSIDFCAFASCRNLASLAIPNSVTSIGVGAFEDTSISSVIIPNGVTNIDERTFYNCTNLLSVSIPNSVTSIGDWAFRECTNLHDVYYSGTKAQWEAINISDNYNTPLIYATIHYNSTNQNDIGEPLGEKVTFNGHTYQLFKLTNITGKDAIAYCNTVGGYMAHINDAEENAFLSNYIRESNVSYAYFGYTDEEVEGEWKWVDGKSSSYTNWGYNEPNNENGKEHYAIINQDGFWNDGKFEGDSAKGCAFVICEWETEQPAEQFAGNVHFLSSYNSETGKVKFDGSSSIVSYTLADTIDKELAASLMNKYVLAETDADSLTITDLKPVESKIGTISAIDKNAYTITIDGEVYPLSRDNSTLTLFADQQIGKEVLFHTYEGTVVSFSMVEKKIGKLESWYSTAQELTIDGKAYPTNFLTDISFLANVDQLLGKKVVYIGAKCNNCFFVFKLIPYTEKLNTPIKDVYNIEVGKEGTVYANIPLQADISSVDFTWTSSNEKVVSFVQDFDLSSIDGTYDGNMNVENASITIPFYARSEGESNITCTLADGTAVAIHKIKVVKSGSDKKVVQSNDYNVYKYNSTSYDNYNQYKEKWYDAYEKYTQAILNAAKQGNNTNFDEIIEAQAKALMEFDQKRLSKYLTFDSSSKEYELSAYKALCETIQPVVDKKINLDDIDLKDITSFSSSTCKAIANAAFKSNSKYEYGDIVVEVSYGGLQIGVGSMVCYKKSKPYDTHYVLICSTLGDSSKCIEDYLTQLVKLEYKAIDNVYNSLAKDICGKTLNQLTSEYLGRKFTDKLEEKLSTLGVGNVKDNLINCNDTWNTINRLATKVLNNQEITLGDLEKLKGYVNIDYTNIKDKATEKALKAISKAQNDLYDEINRVVSNHAGEIQPPKKTLPEMIKSWFACPVSVSVYKDGLQIGYVGDDEIWYNDDIYIEEMGNAKIVYSTPGDNISFIITGNDNGLFSYSIEEYENDRPTGRLNFYDIPVENEKSISAVLPTSNLSENIDNFTLKCGSTSYSANEYIPVSDSAGVNIQASVYENIGGQIYDSGECVRGDIVVLYAIPDDKYVFDGWFDGNGKLISVSDVYEFSARDNVNYIAYFSLDNEEDSVTYTVTFDPVGGTTSENELSTDASGRLNSLPTAARNSYTFDGWFTAAENGDKITTDTVFSENTTVYAHWTKNTGSSESSSVPDTSSDNPIDGSSSDSSDTDSDDKTSSGTSGSTDPNSETSSDSNSNNTSDNTSNSTPNGSSSADPSDSNSGNPSTGITVAVIPVLLAAGASIVIFRKKHIQ